MHKGNGQAVNIKLAGGGGGIPRDPSFHILVFLINLW